MIEEAKTLAYKAHGEQKYGEQPYTAHLEAVAELAKPFGDFAIVLAYLHDVVEDTNVSLSDIGAEFGIFIADCVSLLTDEPGVNRKERKAKTYAKMANIPQDSGFEFVLIVKACDRLANIQSCSKNNPSLLQMYKKEAQAFRNAVFRPRLCDELWGEIDKLIALK